MKRLLYWAGSLVSLACLAFFIQAFAGQWQSLAGLDWGALLGAALLPALLLYLATYALGGKAWELGLRLFDVRASYLQLVRILLLAQIAKYLPGNLGHHVGRVVLARRAGLGTDVVVASMLVDTLLVLVSGAICSLPAAGLMVATAAEHSAGAVPLLSWGIPIGVLVSVALLSREPVRRRLTGWLPVAALRPSLPRLAGILSCHGLSFVAGASALYVICHALAAQGPLATSGWGQVLGIYSAAWLLGFLMPGSPAGLGVREVVLLLGLAPLFGAAEATSAAALLRLVTTAGDGIGFAAGAALRWRSGR